MGDKTRIAWAEASWNPVTGCDQVSEACDHCYAKAIAERFAGTSAYPHGFQVTLHPERLAIPHHWVKPRRIFVCSMADLFHKTVPDEYIAEVLAVAAENPRHTFLILTKRHNRMRHLFTSPEFEHQVRLVAATAPGFLGSNREDTSFAWPLPNMWCGVTVESQKWADVRIPELLETPAAVRFVSVEPMLGPISLCKCDGAFYETKKHPFIINEDCPLHGLNRLDWVICGGESGPGARPMGTAWVDRLASDCETAEIPFFFKQTGNALAKRLSIPGKGADPAYWPEPWPREQPTQTKENS